MEAHDHKPHLECTHAASREARARVLQMQAEILDALSTEFAAAQDGLSRAHRITSEAAGRLVQAFGQMHSAVQSLDELLAAHESGMPPGLHGELRALSMMMTSTSRLATESLQFEDLNAQLLGEVDARLQGLQRMSASLAAPRVSPEGAAACPAGAALDGLANALRGGLAELSAVPRTVQQRSLDPGEVDLF